MTLLALTLGTLLTACASRDVIGSVTGGQCDPNIARTPEYAVKGRTNYDQNWIDETTEGLVGGCGQPRPKARPTSLDAKPVLKSAPAPKPAPKAKFWDRFKGVRL